MGHSKRTIKPIRELKFYYLNDTGEGLGPSADGGHGHNGHRHDHPVSIAEGQRHRYHDHDLHPLRRQKLHKAGPSEELSFLVLVRREIGAPRSPKNKLPGSAL